jgi:DNA-binding transcriptional MerR regulator/methylmalonyl-CoA mutase cobalamin-binding subunit
VSIDVLLGEHSTVPQYNIKAVVLATNTTSSTLRAWERRYQMCTPQRSESGYRLYSEQDIAVIRWLKLQVDSGMVISQAVAWLDRIVEEAGGRDQAVLPGSADKPSTIFAPRSAEESERNAVRSVERLNHELVQALSAYQEHAAEEILAEAFSLYSTELVIEQLIVTVLVEVGQRWHDETLSTTAEHFASNYLIQRLIALLRVGTGAMTGPAIWIGAAPEEHHEIGALLLTIFLRRAGHHVHYLGRDLAIDDLVSEVTRQRPAGLILSAGSVEAVESLRTLSIRIANLGSPQPFIGYGGRIFNERPELKNEIAGAFLGTTALDAVSRIDALLNASEQERDSIHYRRT